MFKPHCPTCNNLDIEDTGVGWKCPDCPELVFTKFQDEKGITHNYTDPDIQRQRMLEESHIYDMDAMDTMVGVTEPGPFFSGTFARLAQLADSLDDQGLSEEANIIDQFLEVNKEKAKPKDVKIVHDVKYLHPNQMKPKIDLQFIPYNDIYSLSGEPLSNL